jgi:folylpolyglutamate synthase/dihydropteroate synthase
MLDPLAAVCTAIVCTTPETPRAMPAEEAATVAASIAGAGWTVTAVPDPAAAISHARRHFAKVVVAGSIFLVGPVRGILRAR